MENNKEQNTKEILNKLIIKYWQLLFGVKDNIVIFDKQAQK